VWPDVPSSCTDNGWTWPGVAQYLSPLAPQLAPRNPANVYPGAPTCRPPRLAPQLRLGSCNTWATKFVTIRGPKRQTSGRNRPILSPAAPGPPSAPPVPGRSRAARRARRLHSTARGSNTGAGPLRAIPVRPQVALAALRALLAARPLTGTHQYTVTRHRAGFTMPRSLPPFSGV
jgi:hypothetical protein